jgi:hypothetical protein
MEAIRIRWYGTDTQHNTGSPQHVPVILVYPWFSGTKGVLEANGIMKYQFIIVLVICIVAMEFLKMPDHSILDEWQVCFLEDSEMIQYMMGGVWYFRENASSMVISPGLKIGMGECKGCC